MDDLTAISRARRTLGSTDDSIPVDVVALAKGLGFEVRESSELPPAQAGNLVVKGQRKIIVLNAHDHAYRKRFTVMHEVAHQVLDLPSVHGGQLESTGLERIKGRPREEVLCDVFAAECLVPWRHIQPLADAREFDATTIAQISNQFHASKQCVASRFAQASRGLVAYVLAEEGVVRAVVASRSLKEAGVWIPCGVPIPDSSAAAQCLKVSIDQATAEIDGSEWSDSDTALQFDCFEEALRPGLIGQTLSLLTFERSAPSGTGHQSVDDEDPLLTELTGVLPWPKR